MKQKNWQEIKSMSSVELNAKLVELEDKYYKLKFRNSTATVKNPLEIREMRKTIARIKTLLEVENGHLDILQISGGEFTLHPQFIEFIDEALKFDIRRIVINTNGLAFLTNDKIFEKIKSLNDKLDIYLQFDGFNDEIYKTLRGKALLKEKLEIVNKLNEATAENSPEKLQRNKLRAKLSGYVSLSLGAITLVCGFLLYLCPQIQVVLALIYMFLLLGAVTILMILMK